MKTIFTTLLLMAFWALATDAQDKVRNYACLHTNDPVTTGPISSIRETTYVEWHGDNTIKMKDGAKGNYVGKRDGYHVYSFHGEPFINMSDAQYEYVVFSEDYSTMQLRVVFGGLSGFKTGLVRFYKSVDDGRQSVNDWGNERR